MNMTSKLIQLASGQVVGSPVTRRGLKRQARQGRLQRRDVYRELRREGLSYAEAAEGYDAIVYNYAREVTRKLIPPENGGEAGEAVLEGVDTALTTGADAGREVEG